MSKTATSPLRQAKRGPAVTLRGEEIPALAFLQERHPKNVGINLAEFRDEADVGWLDVEIHMPRNGMRLIPPVEYRVSPTGRVYRRIGNRRMDEVRGQSYDQRPHSPA